MKQKRTQKILISKFSLTLQPNRNGESAYKVVGFCVILLWWRWRELHRLLRNLPPYASLFGRLGPLPTHQFTELIRFTVALFRVRLSSTFSFRHDKTHLYRWVFACLVEMARVELASESISTKLSPSAAGVLFFRLFTRPSAGW